MLNLVNIELPRYDESGDHTVNEVKVLFCKKKALNKDDFYVTSNGKLVSDTVVYNSDMLYRLCPKLTGGKGGFGSMLRMLGAQIEQTTNHEACRDLSGRRMRDVNNEKKLKEWVGKEAERERERERKKKERLEKRRAKPQHKFEDKTYFNQRDKIADNLDDAISTGIAKALKPGTSATFTQDSLKRKSEDNASKSKKSRTEWLGIDVDSDDISSSDDDDDSNDAEPGPAQATTQDNEAGPSTSEEIVNVVKEDEDTSSSSASTSNEQQLVPSDTTADNSSDNKSNVDASDNNSNTSEHGLLSKLKQLEKNEKDECKEVNNSTSENPTQVTGPIELEKYNTVQELEILGLEVLKSELVSRGLKCGGTLQQRAERLLSVKGLSKDDIDPALFAKPSKGKAKK